MQCNTYQIDRGKKTTKNKGSISENKNKKTTNKLNNVFFSLLSNYCYLSGSFFPLLFSMFVLNYRLSRLNVSDCWVSWCAHQMDREKRDERVERKRMSKPFLSLHIHSRSYLFKHSLVYSFFLLFICLLIISVW